MQDVDQVYGIHLWNTLAVGMVITSLFNSPFLFVLTLLSFR